MKSGRVMECYAKYLKEHDTPRVVRLVGDGWPDLTRPNDLPVAMLEAALNIWPNDLVTDYFITPGGFLTFKWPENLLINDVKRPTHFEIDSLVSAASETCGQFILQFNSASLAEKIRYLTLGVDGECTESGQHAELIMLKDLKTGEAWWTGKSYPTSDQESRLVCFDDLSSHFIQLNADKVLVLGCHDLNLLSNRALASTTSGTWRNKRIIKFRELAINFQPDIALQHPHTADTPRIWSTAWSGLAQALPSIQTYAGAGRWYNPFGSQRGDIHETLRRTAKGRVSTFVVHVDSKSPGVVLSKISSTGDKYLPPKFRSSRPFS